MSYVHMAWMRAVCGRLKSDYSYSNTIVYNNFPWPVVTEKNREQIEKSAQEILKARTLYPNSNLAALYDPLTMPAELRLYMEIRHRSRSQKNARKDSVPTHMAGPNPCWSRFLQTSRKQIRSGT